ncbi:MAG: hypothetical protein OEY51_07810, partial [Cyclobacteriaceae bacterium]|nr:hypothetical protein [Cyclobacteriaceae bacterium]
MKKPTLLLSILLLAACGNPPAENENTALTVPENKAFTQTPYPRTGMMWAGIRGVEGMDARTRHDLMMLGQYALKLVPNKDPKGLADGFTEESVIAAREYVDQLRQANPDAVIIADMLFYEYPDDWLPDEHAWWLRKNGERQQFWPGTHRMDWYNAEYRQKVIRQSLALKSTGVDGVFYDNLRDEEEPWVAFLSDLRHSIGDDFLVLINAGYDVGTYNFAYPYINGIMYESGWSHGRTRWEECIQQMQYSQTLLREPKISLIERF